MSTNSLEKIGTSTLNKGVIAFFPIKSLNLLSSGCAATPTQAASNSGRVVEIMNFLPSLVLNSMS